MFPWSERSSNNEQYRQWKGREDCDTNCCDLPVNEHDMVCCKLILCVQTSLFKQAFLIKYKISVRKFPPNLSVILKLSDFCVFLPAQSPNYWHRWRCSSITWFRILITLDILQLSFKNHFHLCKFLYYANDIGKASESGGKSTAASQPLSVPLHVDCVETRKKNVHFYASSCQLMQQEHVITRSLSKIGTNTHPTRSILLQPVLAVC